MNTGIHAGQVSRLLLFILTIDRLLKSTRRGRKSILFFILSVFHANVSSIQYSKKKKKVEKLDQFPRGKTKPQGRSLLLEFPRNLGGYRCSQRADRAKLYNDPYVNLVASERLNTGSSSRIVETRWRAGLFREGKRGEQKESGDRVPWYPFNGIAT